MRRRSVRTLVLLVTMAVTGAAVWRATTTEQDRGRARLAEQQVDGAAADAVYTLAELKATLHAYVAPGQGLPFWSARAKEQLAQIATLLDTIDPASSAARYPLTEARAALDRLAAAETRVRGHVGNGQVLVAGDIIFEESRTLADTIATEIAGARQALARAASAREAGTANAQSLLAGGVLATWVVALMLLLPVPRERPRTDDATTLSLQAAPGREPATQAGPVGLGPDDPPAAAPAVAASLPPAPDLADLAELCRGLSTAASATDLDPLLERARLLLGARGVMVWLVSADGTRLEPALTRGYDPQVLGRIGTIGRDDDNLTAEAFRSNAATRSAATAAHAAAVAVPLATPTGPAGVLAVEMPPGEGGDPTRAAAVAGVLAAQLANLLASPAPPAESARASTAQA
ncbi:MAG: hypothetical protein R2712_19715 [Vicinamibacterales bacterium]